MKKIKSRYIWITLSVLLVVFGVYRVMGGQNAASNRSGANQQTTVLVQEAQKENLRRFLDLYADIKAENEVELMSPVSGKVLRFNRLEGQSVRRGQSVVSVDRFEVGARYAAAPIETPVNGVVTRILVSEGQDVTPGTPVAMVGNINMLEALIQVPEASTSEVEVGQKVFFQSRAVPNKTYEGTIIRKDLSVDPTTRSLTARAMISNTDGKLFSGIFAESYVFVQEATNAYVVPESALTTTPEGYDALFINENGIAKIRPVTISLRYRDQVAISDGIQDGEEIIVFGREYLTDGTPITALRQESTVESTTPQSTDETLTSEENADRGQRRANASTEINETN